VWTTEGVPHPPRYKKKTDSGFYCNTQLSHPTLWILTFAGLRHLLLITCVLPQGAWLNYSPNRSVAVGGGTRWWEGDVVPSKEVQLYLQVRPTLWSTAYGLGRTWSLLLRRLWVDSLGRFSPAHQLIGAAGPTQLPCDAPTVLRDIQGHSLMAVAALKCGSIDPSASKLSLLIKPTIHRCISSI
jgi:hypothetical protein